MSSTRTRILVPFDDKKHVGAEEDSTSWDQAQALARTNRFRSLTESRDEALHAFLAAINGHGHAEQVLSLKGEKLEVAVRRNESFLKGSTRPALERFAGPLYAAVDASSLPAAALRRLKDEAIIVCPLLGLLGARDLIPDYRCPMAAQIPDFGSLHHFWKPKVGPVLDRVCRGRHVVSLLPGRLRALWVPKANLEVTTVAFVRVKGRDARASAHAGAKGLAGEFVRAMLLHEWASFEDMQAFESSKGHTFDPALSTLEGVHRELVFSVTA